MPPANQAVIVLVVATFLTMWLLFQGIHGVLFALESVQNPKDWPQKLCTAQRGVVEESCQETRCFYRANINVTYHHPQIGNVNAHGFRYSSDFFGDSYKGALEFVSFFSEGKSYDCWYSPTDPSVVRVRPDNSADKETERTGEKNLFATLYFLVMIVFALCVCAMSGLQKTVAEAAQEELLTL